MLKVVGTGIVKLYRKESDTKTQNDNTPFISGKGKRRRVNSSKYTYAIEVVYKKVRSGKA